jgi:DNA mismatch endonuclease (patch repair protein)
MVDVLSKTERSERMRSIRSEDTKPEIRVRKVLQASGFRYRLHDHRLPGKPDIVLPRWKTVVLVHGCFWHGHRCKGSRVPSSNVDYWVRKIAGNKARDATNIATLESLGWRVYVLWECELKATIPGIAAALRAVGVEP